MSSSELVNQHSLQHQSLLTTKQNNSRLVDDCPPGPVVNNSFLSNPVHPSLPLSNTDSNAACHLSALTSIVPSPSALTSLVPSAITVPRYLPPAEIQSSFADLLAAQTNNDKNMPPLMTSLSLSGCGRGLSGCGQGQSECGCGLSGCGCGLSCCGRGQRGDSFDVTLASCLPPSYTEVLQARTLTLMPTTTSPFINSDVTEAAVDARFLHQNQLPRAATVPADWVYEGSNEGKMGELATVDVVGQMSTVGDDSSSSDVLSRPVISTFTRSVSEDLRVLTSRLMKSHVEDLTLHRTPRGSGAGYGVGCHELLQSSLAAELSSSELPRAGQEG